MESFYKRKNGWLWYKMSACSASGAGHRQEGVKGTAPGNDIAGLKRYFPADWERLSLSI